MCAYKIMIPNQKGLEEVCEILIEKDFDHVLIIEGCQTSNNKHSAIVCQRQMFGKKVFKARKYHA